jgi:hypothetical protein
MRMRSGRARQHKLQKNHTAIHRSIRETQYLKFVSLRKANNLYLSDYADIWKVIIYLLSCEAIYKAAGNAQFLIKYSKFRALRKAIDEYNNNAFSPEIATALQFVEDSSKAAKLVAKHVEIEANISAGQHFKKTINSHKFQTNLLFIQRQFEEAISSLRLDQNFILFIDGIDIRPSSIPYNEYLDCVKGLANAVWSVNNDFFPAIRDSKGRIRAVLLVRPDIFNSLGLQNRNTKLRDNSVLLDWRTTYPEHRSSDIFRLADRMFSAQQDKELPLGAAWDYYFPFDAATVYSNYASSTSFRSSFVVFLRYSFYRPRDILTILDFLRRLYASTDPNRVFRYEDLFTPAFRRDYGDYVLGEIKDSLSFYYNETEFEDFVKFFEFLDGAHKFDYEKYIHAYKRLLS